MSSADDLIRRGDVLDKIRAELPTWDLPPMVTTCTLSLVLTTPADPLALAAIELAREFCDLRDAQDGGYPYETDIEIKLARYRAAREMGE